MQGKRHLKANVTMTEKYGSSRNKKSIVHQPQQTDDNGDAKDSSF